jgi:hypothetical protein
MSAQFNPTACANRCLYHDDDSAEHNISSSVGMHVTFNSQALNFWPRRGNAFAMIWPLRNACLTPLDHRFGRSWPLHLVCLLVIACSPAAAQTCDRTEFEAVVAKTSDTLRELTAEKKPAYQSKLRGLMQKRGWTYDQLVKEAGPLVADDKVTAYDQASADLLAKINRMGDAGLNDTTSAKGPDCAVLTDLRATMAALVTTQTEKWTYLFAKLDAETAR